MVHMECLTLGVRPCETIHRNSVIKLQVIPECARASMLGLGILDTDITFEMSGRTDHLWLVSLFQKHGAQPLRIGMTEILMDLL